MVHFAGDLGILVVGDAVVAIDPLTPEMTPALAVVIESTTPVVDQALSAISPVTETLAGDLLIVADPVVSQFGAESANLLWVPPNPS